MTSAFNDIAILGAACRLPGAPNVDSFWSLLSEGRHAIGTIGGDRWSTRRFWHPRRSEPGKTYALSAGLLDNVYDFDAAFFGISPREAAQMDPQQRLLLEVTWEAMEDAGLRPSSLSGSGAGVYVGASGTDYASVRQNDPKSGDMHFMTGNTLSIISNRISYFFDLRGPSFTLDTACSSSLLALHQAATAIRAGHVDTAVVAGVNLLLSPFPFMGFSRASMLSPTGLCHAFDASADGYVRAEGCVAVILQSMDRARDADHRVRAVLAASGTNADGRTVGLSLPSSESQAALLQEVYQSADIDPENLAFIEAHGTGTQVGDPSEALSIGRVLGQRRGQSLPIGSAKTNVGHLEPASGLVGVLKALLALERDLLPASLHFDSPNPNIPFDDLNLSVAARALPLPRNGALRYAGINSFGFGGTNVHAVIRDAERPQRQTAAAEEIAPLILSARCEPALRAMVSAYRERLEQADSDEKRALVAAAASQRDRLEHRMVLWEGSPEALFEQLAAAEAGEKSRAAFGRTIAGSEAPAFLFAGNGSQWAGMGREAFERNAAYRASVEGVDALFTARAGWSLIEAFQADDLAEKLRRAEVAQPLLFALQVGLVDALAAWGLKPGAVAGHSVGEVAAAYVSGALTLEQAVHVVHARSLHQESTHGAGSMAALLLSAEDAAEVLADARWQGLQIAAINGPRSITISGEGDLLKVFAAEARKCRWPLRRLELDYPFHGPLMEPVREPLLQDLSDLTPQSTVIPFVSTVTAELLDGKELTADYWWRNVREPVRFRDAITRLGEQGHGLFLEIGPRPVLQGYINDSLRHAGANGRVLPALDRNDAAGVDPVRGVLARAFAAGAPIDEALALPERGSFVPLPGYPWQRKTYRVDPTQEAWNLSGGEGDHPLLGYHPRPELPVWTVHLDHELLPYLADHCVEDAVVFPAAGFVEMALAAGEQWLGTGDLEIQDMEIVRPLVFDGERMREVQLRLSDDSLVFEVFSRSREEESNWNQHLRGRLARLPSPSLSGTLPDAKEFQGRSVSGPDIYATARRFGLNYGPAFARVQKVDILGERQARVRLSHELPQELIEPARYLLHPTTLDAVFHGLFALLEETAEVPANTAFLPARLGRVRRLAEGGEPREALIEIASVSPRSVAVAFRLFDESGTCVAALDDCRFRAVALSHAQDEGQLEFRFVARPELGASEIDSSATPTPTNLRGTLTEAGFARSEEATPEESWLLLDGAIRSLAFDALSEALGHSDAPFTLDDLMVAGRLSPEVAPLFGRILRLLEEDGATQYDEESGWRLIDSGQFPPASDVLNLVASEHPDRLAEVALTARLMELLPGLLDGRMPPPAELPYAAALLDQLTDASPARRTTYAAVVAAVEAIVADWPAERPVRILELASGTGSLSRRLLRILPTERFSYLASDPDKRAVDRLRVSLGPHPNLEVETLDFSKEPKADLGPFDLVVCAGGLYRAAGTAEQLANLRSCMAGGGLLVAAEPEPSPFYDLLFGVRAEWWGEGGPTHASGPLKEASAWRTALEAGDFPAIECLPLAGPGPEQSLLIARNAVRAVRSVPSATAGSALILADAKSRTLASDLAQQLSEAGRQVVIAGVEGAAASDEAGAALDVRCGDCSDQAWLEGLIKELQVGDGESLDVIHLQGALAGESHPSAAAAERCTVAMAALKALSVKDAGLWLVTPGAMQHVAGGEAERPVQAALWGFGRVAANEYADVRIRMIDPAPDYEPARMAALVAAEVLRPTNEHELVINDQGRHALRLRRGLPRRPETGGRRRREAGLRLEMRRAGSLDQLAWTPMRRRLPGPGEVEIEVAATGLNFRDVMWAMGLLPDEALEEGFAGPTLGMECAGVITAVGEGVTGMQTGTRVLSFAPACFASHVTVSTRAVAPIPGDLSFEQAATVPSAFFTAYYALTHLAQLEEGERVLVHGGAGGVGLAALQLAKWRGAEVVATAGSPEKRALLRLLGADHVLDSRSLEFADGVMELTDGEGVDVVLNSLAGEAMERSLQILRPFGRFLELGKRDFYGGSRLGLRPFRQNISYFGIDADQLLTRRPQLAGRLFREMVELFREGHLRPLPYRRFDHEEAVQAFRLMQQSGHIGKIVVAAPPVEARRLPERTKALELVADATYLVAGGLGGFGLETAQWLVRHGARHLLLLGRSGASSDAARAGVEALQAAGATVVVEACDLADQAAVEAVIARAKAEMPPLRGVLHTAMVLEDGLIANLDRERFDKVLQPKVDGAWNLHCATLDLPLDLFVLYSSATTTVGNPGQANYVAANAYLESLARQRRAEGLPAVAVAWGAIGDAGYLARHAEVSESLSRRLGRQSLGAREALDGLERILVQGAGEPANASPVYARIDWRSAKGELPILSQPGFREMAAEADSGGGEVEDKIDLRKMVEGMDAAAARDLISGLLADEVARILRLPAEEVDRHRPLAELGMDSLMALELRMAAEQRLSIEVPLMSLSDGATLDGVAARLAGRLISGEDKVDERDEAMALARQHLDEQDLEELGLTDGAGEGDSGVARVG
ncbi:SDR family NAD(P)-dependent oxidoreductase [Aquibaculum sediminis]|uniref:SDR family NAD(P)-dependent oxidoreductase n=1 Tax=Aquibaculum sediminis TaxID=3231907 RepID=UPI003454A958